MKQYEPMTVEEFPELKGINSFELYLVNKYFDICERDIINSKELLKKEFYEQEYYSAKDEKGEKYIGILTKNYFSTFSITTVKGLEIILNTTDGYRNAIDVRKANKKELKNHFKEYGCEIPNKYNKYLKQLKHN